MYSLSICIPTFRRVDECCERVRELMRIRESSEVAELFILNNDPDAGALERRLEACFGSLPPWIKVLRRRDNIGGDANIMRGFETASAEYLWVLGDDDVVCDDALIRIKKAAERYPDAVALHFNSRFGKVEREGRVAQDLSRIVELGVSLGDMLLISATVYKRSFVGHRMATAYSLLNSHGAAIVTVLSSLGEEAARGRITMVMEGRDIALNQQPADPRQQYSLVPVALTIGTALGATERRANYDGIRILIHRTCSRWLTFLRVYLAVLGMFRRTRDWPLCRRVYRDISIVLYWRASAWKQFGGACLVRAWMAAGPGANQLLVETAERCVGKRMGSAVAGEGNER